MSTHLRDDRECLNCGHLVEEAYCSRCGQKNTQTRQSLLHLVAHFAEDLTHYDGAFWRTIKFLLFRPAYLTKQYLEGKRQSYVPPVKLYIFISFISFVLPALIPTSERQREFYAKKEERPAPDVNRKEISGQATIGYPNWEGLYWGSPFGYRTVREMDSIEAIKPDSLRLSPREYKTTAKFVKLYEFKTPYEVGSLITAQLPSIISKTIFLYMPVFAFWLWIMHNKKRWYFFEHGIFTLHYFSLLMITTSVIVTLFKIFIYFDSDVLEIPIVIGSALLLYQVWYFYKAHKNMYYESGLLSFAKSTALFIINLGLIAAIIWALIKNSYNMLL
jgi:hypothetical protein